MVAEDMIGYASLQVCGEATMAQANICRKIIVSITCPSAIGLFRVATVSSSIVGDDPLVYVPLAQSTPQ